jgi:Tol biopolymer transport system component
MSASMAAVVVVGAILAAALAAATIAAGGPAELISAVADLPILIRGRIVAPPPGEKLEPTAAAQEKLRDLRGRIAGFVVWASNREGDHDLFRMDLPGMEVRRLTRDPHVDYYGRISPDGSRIVFMRSRSTRRSVREASGWEIWVASSAGGDERRLAEEGYRPTWGADGASVYFMKDRSGYRVDPRTGETEELFVFPDGLPRIRYGGVFIHPDGRRLAVAFRGGITRIFELPDFRERVLDDSQSCQTLWAPGLDGLVWIQAQGEGGNRVMRADAEGSNHQVLIDLHGSHAHEYFPSVSRDGRWLVWGATAQGHEHDRADYEIFLWEIGTPAETTLRLTRHTGNDMWPDIWTR